MKKFIRTIFIPLIALTAVFLFAFCAGASSTPRAVVGGETIVAVAKDSQTYLFLPSCADLAAVQIDTGSGEETVNVSALPEENGAYVLTRNGVTVRIMRSANAGALFVKFGDPAYARSWVDSSPDHSNDAGKMTTVNLTMFSKNGGVVYNGKLTSFKGRGNTTWGSSAKKPYQIKLDKKTDLLESGNNENKNKTWILLANALDKTLMKNALAFDISRELGLTETPEYTFVDLYTDGKYRGLYQLCEKVQIASGRVDIDELEEHNEVADETATARGTNSMGLEYQYNPTAVCDKADITGGYLLEQDGAFYAKENSWFKLYTGSTVVVKSPEYCTKEQIEYISVLFNRAFHAAQDNIYEGTGVTELIDIDSLASLYMINEYTKNIDFTASSTYFFLPEKGNAKYDYKFYGGPAWDFDTSMGNRTEYDSLREPRGLNSSESRMFRGTLVRSAIKDKAAKISALRGVIFAQSPSSSGFVHSLSWYRSQIYDAQKMNFTLWPFDDTGNTFCYRSYEENYNYVFNFLQTRHDDILPRIAALNAPDYNIVKNCARGNHIPENREATCTEGGIRNGACVVCGAACGQAENIPALGHIDADKDKLCDRCGKYTGSVPSFFEPMMRFFAKILRFFRQIFN